MDTAIVKGVVSEETAGGQSGKERSGWAGIVARRGTVRQIGERVDRRNGKGGAHPDWHREGAK